MPIVIHDEIWEKLLSAIASGLTEKDACSIVGVGRSTLHTKKVNEPEFREKVRQANVAFKLKHLQNITEHANKWWQASSWLLERKFPEEFGQASKLDITSGGKAIKAPSWFGGKLGYDADDAEIVEDETTD